MSDKCTMTLNLSAREMEVLEELAVKKDMNKTQVMRQALRLYQYIEHKHDKGEQIMFQDRLSKLKTELVIV